MRKDHSQSQWSFQVQQRSWFSWEGEAPAEPSLGRARLLPSRSLYLLGGRGSCRAVARTSWEGEAPAEPSPVPLGRARLLPSRFARTLGRARLLPSRSPCSSWEGEAPAEPFQNPVKKKKFGRSLGLPT